MPAEFLGNDHFIKRPDVANDIEHCSCWNRRRHDGRVGAPNHRVVLDDSRPRLRERRGYGYERDYQAGNRDDARLSTVHRATPSPSNVARASTNP